MSVSKLLLMTAVRTCLLYQPTSATAATSAVSTYIGNSCCNMSAVSTYISNSCYNTSAVSTYISNSYYIMSAVSTYISNSCYNTSAVSTYINNSCHVWVRSQEPVEEVGLVDKDLFKLVTCPLYAVLYGGWEWLHCAVWEIFICWILL